MCAGEQFEAWQAKCILDVLKLGFVDLSALIIDADPDKPAAAAPAARVLRALRSHRIAWNLFHRASVRRRSTASRLVDLSAELRDVNRIHCAAPRQGKWARYFSRPEVDEIRSHELDFMLRFAFNIVKGQIHEAANLGVWSFHHDDLYRYRGPPACFWPMEHGDPIQGVTLQRLTDGIDNGVVLAQAWCRTILHSYAKNRDSALWAGVGMVARVCKELHAGGGEQAWGTPAATTAPIRSIPGRFRTIKFSVRLGWRKAAKLVQDRFRSKVWGVGVVDLPITELLDRDTVPDARWLGRAKGRADASARPGGFVSMGGSAGLPGASVPTIADQAELELLRPDLDSETATKCPSFAVALQDSEHRYCVTGSHAAREVVLFRALKEPGRWERVATLLTGVSALDPTLFKWEGRWWLMAGLEAVPGTGSAVELHAWHATEIEGPFEPHDVNPIKMDIRSSRPAGTPFVRDGRLYRPAQDCSRDGAYAVAICHVRCLTPTEFSEDVMRVLGPNPRSPYRDDLRAIHALGQRTLVIGGRSRWTAGWLLHRVRASRARRA